MHANHNSQLDHPATTISRRTFIAKKQFMRQIYQEWYRLLKQNLPVRDAIIIELGSGPGFLSSVLPEAISSDVLLLPYLDVVMNGMHLPLDQSSVDALLLVDVFHHIPDVNAFFTQTERVLRVGGRLVMIEPWITRWSHWIYTRFHHEAVDMDSLNWSFPSSGPLSGANQALPWNVFHRDRSIFQEKFPNLKIVSIQPMMPITYIMGGGFSLRASLPGFTYPIIRWIESKLIDEEMTGMFCLVVLERIK
jgi:SAM-dependent methyltransferase